MRGRRLIRKYRVGTPFKSVVKSTRYKKPGYAVRTLLKVPKLREATLHEVTKVVKNECNELCKIVPSPSYLRRSSVQSLQEFKWEPVIYDLHAKAPVLTAILEAATQCSQRATPPAGKIAMAAAILLKARSRSMCKLQTLVASLLYAGHASKKVGCHVVFSFDLIAPCFIIQHIP